MVADDGIGIKTENQNRVWDRFFRVDTSREYTNESFGLGLSLVKWILEVHGGEISLESEVDKGTRFKFWLPIR
ncbi:ATP-binding protein [Selenomonadales bacterium OttesenSCG-928-I06]|nr:ATP-binding protein [Selenomonadales bacterium OttesenSCG-928-I06]